MFVFPLCQFFHVLCLVSTTRKYPRTCQLAIAKKQATNANHLLFFHSTTNSAQQMATSNVICRYHKAGVCANGRRCKFSHDLSGTELSKPPGSIPIQCKYYKQSACCIASWSVLYLFVCAQCL